MMGGPKYKDSMALTGTVLASWILPQCTIGFVMLPQVHQPWLVLSTVATLINTTACCGLKAALLKERDVHCTLLTGGILQMHPK
jgi:hypothetical protein